MTISTTNVNQPANSDPLLAPPSSMPESPLLLDEEAPLRPSLLDFNPTNRHMENLDALRIVAMAVIIISHVLTPYADAVYSRHQHTGSPLGSLFFIMYAINVSTRFGVPCFMMISFYIYWHQLYDKNRTWMQLLKRRFKRLFPAFCCWSLIYLAIHRLGIWLIAHHFVNNHGSPSFSVHFKYIDLKQWQTWFDVFILGQAEYHLYYLAVIMQCLLLIPLLRLLWKKPLISWGWIAITVIGWTVTMYAVAFLPKTSAPHRAIESLVTATPTFGGTSLTQPHPFYKGLLNEETALPLLVFPLLGFMCAGQKPLRNFIAHSSTRFWIGVLIAGIALHLIEAFILLPKDLYVSMTDLKLGRLVTGLAVFILFLRRPLMRDPIPRLSHHAFGMHFMHPAIILFLMVLEQNFLGQYLGNFEHYVLPTLLINLALTFALTFALCITLSRSKRLEFLVV